MLEHSLSRHGVRIRIELMNREQISVESTGSRRVRQRGFSLLELLVVAALVIIAATMAVPSGTRNLEAARLGSAAQEMSYRISETRMRAISQNTRTRLVLMAQQRRYQVQILEREVWSADGTPVELPASASVVQGGTVEFLPSGLAVSGVTFEMASGELTKRVFVSRAGGVIY